MMLRRPAVALLLLGVQLSGAECTTPAVTPTATLTAITVSPPSTDLPVTATQQFTAAGTWSDGSSAPPSVTWSATGGTVTSQGMFTAGTVAGQYRVIATDQGGTKADTAQVTVTPATLEQLILAPSSATIPAGGTRQFTVSGVWSDGGSAVPSATFSATGGTISANGLYTAGSTPGTFRVIAVQSGGTLADTSAVTISPAVLTQLTLSPPTATVATGGNRQFTVTGAWSDGSNTVPAVTYSATGGTISAGGLYTAGGTAGNFRVIATQQGGGLADTSQVTVTSATGSVLVQENFDDGNGGSRGWFDMSGSWPVTTSEHIPGSTASIQWHWPLGVVKPVNAAGRHDFTPSNSVYLSYWVKQSSNWIGSAVTYDPHMFYLLTTIDAPAPGATPGLSRTHLTVYNELNYVVGSGGSRAHAAMQDALNINATYLNQDVSPGHTPTTENRSVSGYNGVPENSPQFYAFLDDYSSGGLFFNGKWWASNYPAPGTLVLTDATKTSWHHIEAYHQLNTVVGGIGQRDGVLQFWYDGTLLVDRHDVYYRTGQYPTMQFTQLVMAPYMSPNGGTGSPVDQSMWIDNLTVATAKP